MEIKQARDALISAIGTDLYFEIDKLSKQSAGSPWKLTCNVEGSSLQTFGSNTVAVNATSALSNETDGYLFLADNRTWSALRAAFMKIIKSLYNSGVNREAIDDLIDSGSYDYEKRFVKATLPDLGLVIECFTGWCSVGAYLSNKEDKEDIELYWNARREQWSKKISSILLSHNVYVTELDFVITGLDPIMSFKVWTIRKILTSKCISTKTDLTLS